MLGEKKGGRGAVQWLADWIRGTALPMTVPEPYGAFHLAVFGAGMALAVLLALLLRHSTERQNRAVLLVTGLILLLSEGYKQLFWYYAVGYIRYPFILFPFHLCSIPMYLCILAALLPKGPVRQTLYDFLATYCAVGGFASLFVPEGLSHAYWPLTLHAFGWHILLVFLGLYLGFSGRVGRAAKGFGRAAGLYACLCLAALYINIGFWDVSGGTIDMFFVGPAPMSVVVYSDIAAVIGRVPVTLFFMATFTLGAGIAYCLLRLAGRGAARRRAVSRDRIKEKACGQDEDSQMIASPER